MVDEHRIGTLRRNPPMRLAEESARWIVQCDGPMAVCLDPDGVVTVEPAQFAIDDELVGVYSPELGRFELYKRIRDDLRASIAERKAAA